jgi:hypothetical protein
MVSQIKQINYLGGTGTPCGHKTHKFKNNHKIHIPPYGTFVFVLRVSKYTFTLIWNFFNYPWNKLL